MHTESERGTELKKAQGRAESFAQQLVAVLEGMQDGFLETDRDWNITRVNRNQELMSRVPRRETLGKNFWRVFPDKADPKGRYWVKCHGVLERQKATQFEEYQPLLQTWNEYSVFPRNYGGLTVFYRDITKRKDAERRLAEQVTALESERALREIFVSTLSHDLRNPLSVIQMSSEVMITGAQYDPKLTAMIYNAAQRSIRMIENLLDANRIKAGQDLPLHIEENDLAEIVEEIVEDLSMFHPGRLVFAAPEGDFHGYWSSDSLRRMIENLCSNAIKYGAAKGAVTIQLARSCEKFEISVHNFGNPISPTEQSSLFEPFQRSLSAQESGQTGWGLGLALVLGIARAHGGTVRLESNAELGTFFTLVLPQDARPYEISDYRKKDVGSDRMVEHA